jgi:DNA repair exonuclease SbcCD ATPase subunit
MERVEFKDLDIYNFMCFKDASLHLNSRGLHFVYGEVRGQLADSNGAGKSAWVEALSWCLFGKTLRDMKADDIINSTVGKDCSVVLLFNKGATSYIVNRYRKSTEKGNGVSFSSGAGEDDLVGATNEETNKKIEDVLGFSFDLFKNTICHGQGLPYRFTQATDAEKKEIP